MRYIVGFGMTMSGEVLKVHGITGELLLRASPYRTGIRRQGLNIIRPLVEVCLVRCLIVLSENESESEFILIYRLNNYIV